MDLLCTERSGECAAYPDPRLLGDPRVLQNLLKTEETYTSNSSYFQCVQKEITPQMRKIVAEWMLEVCEQQRCQEGVFPLAMNYMDRFLSQSPLSKSLLQTVGAVCLLLASKLREPRPLTAKILVYFTDFSTRLDQFSPWELVIADRLKWDLAAVTAQDFIAHILYRIPLDRTTEEMTRRHASTFISLAACDFKFSMYTPSIIAGASIAAALNGLHWNARGGWTLNQLMDTLTVMLSVEKEYLCSCLAQLEEMLTDTLTEAAAHMQKAELTKAGTPTDVQDIDF
ncbi:G1/S-specific cyclin-D2 [Cimex lectularius]|uniref:Cyclin D n=1 Tax=Cimex lectularius TaxID=79782 RepID=A0A8I6RM26_CIMLE|nr:G1/S-specific cyclin-D2 [Cimex lectularius]